MSTWTGKIHPANAFRGPLRWTHLFHIAIFIAAIWLSYGKCMSHDFAWDDHGLIVNNVHLKARTSWHGSFLRHFWQVGENAEDPTRSFYRPLISISYRADYLTWGLNPRGFHLTNILLHGVVVLFFYFVAVRLLGSSLPAYLAALIWAVHPTHVENVCWISGRTDVICALWFLVSFWCFLHWMRSYWKLSHWAAAAVVAFGAALLSKEMAITLPALFILYYFLAEHGRPTMRSLLLLVVMTVFCAGAYLGIRKFVLSAVIGAPAFGTLTERLLSIPYVFARYLGLILSMSPVDPHHSDLFITTVKSPQFVVGVLTCAAYLMWLIWLLRKEEYTRLFLFLWFPVTLAPVMLLGSFGDVIVADRFLYIPSIGLILGITHSLGPVYSWCRERAPSFSAIAAILFTGYLLSLVGYSRSTSAYWKNGVTLFRRALYTSPRSAYVHYNLANSLASRGAYQAACAAYKDALTLLPTYTQARVNMAACLNRLGRYDESLRALAKALEAGDHSDLVYINMGDANRGLAGCVNAVRCYERAMRIRNSGIAHNRMGSCLMALGHEDEALVHFKEAIALDPSAESYDNVGSYFLKQGRPKMALVYLERALADANRAFGGGLRAGIHFHLAQAYAEVGEKNQSDYHCRKALKVAPLTLPGSDLRREIHGWMDQREEPE